MYYRASFQIKRRTLIHTDHIAEIDYSPPGRAQRCFGSLLDKSKLPPTPSYLNIDLKDKEHIRLQGAEADEAWQAFQAVQPGRALQLSDTVRQKIARLPNDALDLDNHHVAGILARHQLARECLCQVMAQDRWKEPNDALLLDALRSLVELDVPAMLQMIAGLEE